jgi:SPP1 gp7 family putative phage head morphogenesis protein
MANDALVAAFSQHTVYLNRVAASQGNAVLPYLDNIYSGINQIYAKYSSRKNITQQLKIEIRKQVSDLVSSELQIYTRELKKEQREIGIYETEFSASALNAVVLDDDFQTTIPAAAQVTAAAIATPIKIGENNYITYNSMMRNYWMKWTDELDAIVANGFATGQTISEIQKTVLDEIKPSKSGLTKSALDRARRGAKTIAITGTNHYANQSRVVFAQDNLDVIKGYIFLAVVDSRVSQQCRSLDKRTFKSDDPNLSKFTPPLHPNCRSALTYEVDDKYKLDDDDNTRASRFRIDGKLDPKPISSNQTYYQAMNNLNAADQNAILGTTMGKAFRKLDNPDQFAKLTIDSLGNPLTITEMKARDNALSRILNNQ